MQYNKLSALAQDTALKVEELEYSSAVAFIAAGEEKTIFSYGNTVHAGIFAMGSYTLTVDGQQAASGSSSGVYSAYLAAGKHTISLTCSNGLAVISGGRLV